VQRFHDLLHRWNSQSLARQFLIAGGLVSIAALLLVGAFVTSVIEAAVTRHSAATTALYVDSVIAPLLPDMRTSRELDQSITRALDETLAQGALGDRLASYRIWRRDGTLLYSSDKSLDGRAEPGENDLRAAFAGEMVAEYNRPEDAGGQPLLKIYNPILQPWSCDVVAVSEFHEIATDFQRTLRYARIRSWLAVHAVTLAFFLALSAIVFRGSRTIDQQSRALQQRVGELSDLLAQNKALHARVQRASRRVAALNESHLRKVGADLHDGPAQLIALAALRLDNIAADAHTSPEAREKELAAIKANLDEALGEIRSISSGLVLPQIEAAELPEILAKAVRAHEQRTGTSVELSLSGPIKPLPPSAKICIYRFVQEALNNSYRHGGGKGQRVEQTSEGGLVGVEVIDGGPGFDPAAVRPESLGLAGLRERVESLGGRFSIESSDGGTRVKMSIRTEEMEQA
jgi:signal transduction histidine kinase